MTKTILITGAGSGFGEGAAIGMAENGHSVIATVQISPQVAALRRKVDELGLKNLRVEKLDLLDPYDVAYAQTWDIDVLFNNAGVGEAGPVSEIPVDLVRRNFEVNVHAPLALTQGFINLGGQLKTGNLWTGQNRQFRTAETAEFYFVRSSTRKSVWSFVRQLRGPHLSTCA
jgi:NAD(P)-dependent dehydrogenase (short-subunit alcohol dehydrogenase family)